LPGHIAHDGDAALMPMALAGVALFGIGGLFGRAAGYLSVGQLITAILLGVFGAAFALAIFGALHRAQSPEPTALRQLIGRTARVTVSIGPTIRGTVRLTYDGSVQTLPAVAATPIARDRDVIVVAVRGMALAVREMPPP
jgi:membrane protein implicated in regulation of membrane protease activity